MKTEIWQERAPVHVDLTFDTPGEAKALYEELQTWTPSGGWSDVADEFFQALANAGSYE